MNTLKQVLTASLILAGLLILGFSVRIGVPYHQQEKDRPETALRRTQVKAIMNAIFEFSEIQQRFPTNLAELYAIPSTTLATNTAIANRATVLNDFYLFPASVPPTGRV